MLIAVIFMSVMLAFGVVLGSIAYKQEVLASSAIDSQYAFYAGDAGLECALFEDQQYATGQSLFAYDSNPNDPVPTFSCNATAPYTTPTRTLSGSGTAALQVLSYEFALDSDSCVYIDVYKYQYPQPPANLTTYIFSQGFSASCATVAAPGKTRFSSRGIQAHY